MSSFDRAFALVVGEEGGYVNDVRDPGGETRFGISKRAHPTVDIRNLTLAGAKAIYKAEYWDTVQGDALPPALALILFDFGVNAGVKSAAMMLQRLLGVPADGSVGPRTLAAVEARHGQGGALIVDLLTNEMLFKSSLRTWGIYGRGWMRRAMRMAMVAATWEAAA